MDLDLLADPEDEWEQQVEAKWDAGPGSSGPGAPFAFPSSDMTASPTPSDEVLAGILADADALSTSGLPDLSALSLSPGGTGGLGDTGGLGGAGVTDDLLGLLDNDADVLASLQSGGGMPGDSAAAAAAGSAASAAAILAAGAAGTASAARTDLNGLVLSSSEGVPPPPPKSPTDPSSATATAATAAATAARPSMTSALDAFLLGVDNKLLGSPTPPPAVPDSPRRSTTVERRGQLRRHLQDLLQLQDPQEDFDALCERCFQSGIPDDSGLRPVLWRLLLGYLPRDRTAWAPTLAKRRAEYAELRARFITPEIDEYMRQPREIIFRCDR